jgi:hypothetical protein
MKDQALGWAIISDFEGVVTEEEKDEDWSNDEKE